MKTLSTFRSRIVVWRALAFSALIRFGTTQNYGTCLSKGGTNQCTMATDDASCNAAKKLRLDVGGPTVEISSGVTMPLVGLGTWKSKAGQVENAVKHAIRSGYRHIDCAAVYGNEIEVGTAIAEMIADGSVKREDLFITSKLWNSFHHAGDVRAALENTLKDLQLDYVDLYLIHWPIALRRDPGRPDKPISECNKFPKDEAGGMIYASGDEHYSNAWPEMEKCAEAGLARNIGLSNFNSEQIAAIKKDARIQPAVLQVESHPYLNQEQLLAFAKGNGLTVTAYSPLGSPDRPWARPEEPKLLEDPKLVPIAEKYGKTVAQVLIRFQVERGVVVIPKSVTPSRIVENFDVFDFSLTEEDLTTLRAFHNGWRACIPKITLEDGSRVPRDGKNKDYPFNIPF